MKTLLLSLLISLIAFGQDVTNEAYWLAQPPEVRVLQSEPDASARNKIAEGLAKAGYKIDVPVMVYQWDAYKVMKMRKDYGYTWVPSALMPNISIAPGLISQGGTPYDPNSPPSGSIKVSTDAKDYPAYDKPVVAPEAPVSPVGPLSIGNLYLTTVGDTLPNGTVVTESRGKFVKRIQAGPFGAWAYWEML